MPRMDGITFLKNLMKLRPLPVVMVSTLTQAGGLVTLDALEIGAVDYIAKPQLEGSTLNDTANIIREKVRVAAKTRVSTFDPDRFTQKSVLHVLDKEVQHANKIVAIGASTGGTEAIKDVLIKLPGQMVPIVITQHIPGAFSASYAQRLDRICQMNVVEVVDGMKVSPGYAYVAPGDKHLSFQRVNNKLVCRLLNGELVNRHKPSVEVMFDSLRSTYTGGIISVMLTGMGNDGASAMLRMSQDGHDCLIQDEASSVVWGMPKAAYDLGASDSLVSLPNMPQAILNSLKKNV